MSGSFLGPAVDYISNIPDMPGVIKADSAKFEAALNSISTSKYDFEGVIVQIYPVEENGMMMDINGISYLVPLDLAFSLPLEIDQIYRGFTKIIEITEGNRAMKALEPIIEKVAKYKYISPDAPIDLEA